MPDAPRRARARTPVDPARQVAYDTLRAVEIDDAYLNLTLSRLLSQRRIAGRDAAFATELAAGTARLQGSYDLILDALATGGVAGLQPAVLTALRLGVHQLLSMRVPAHAAVGTTVELARTEVGERPVRLVNAVLRRVADRDLESWLSVLAPARDADLVGHLAAVHAHPRWIVEAFVDALGSVPGSGHDRAGDARGEIEDLLRADNVPPAVTLVTRPGVGRTDSGRPTGPGVRPGRWSPYAGILDGGDPGELPDVRAGRVGVQDEGSQLVALAFARAAVSGSDERWLDICAGPGGKAALLTGLARQRGATLVANERQPHRATLVQSALRAYGRPCTVVCADGRTAPWRADTFDRVIVDAPCTGLGALRRRPEARWRRTPTDLELLVPLQRALLRSALDSTRPGGVAAYVTCSPHPAETSGVVEAVLAERPDVSQEDARGLLPEVDLLGDGPHVQLWPHRHGTDAMFLAVLRRLT
jgi:16S rRNA (cytosine967-C5)-methyltransferase